MPPDELTLDKALEFLAAPTEGRVLGTDPDSGLPIYAKAGRFRPPMSRSATTTTSRESPVPHPCSRP